MTLSSTSVPVAIPRRYETIVTANERLTPKIFWLRLQTAELLSYTPGQYASFLIDTFRRPLSFALPPAPDLEFIVDVSPGGVASQFVVGLRPGDTVAFMSPYGRFVVTDTGRPLVFIAAGSGIGPIRAQIIDALSRGVSSSLTLVFGNRDHAHMFFLDEFTQLARRYPQFTFIPACSDNDPTWTGERGLVTDVARRLVPTLLDSDVYVCGGPAMVSAALAMLQSMNIPAEQIHTEKFI